MVKLPASMLHLLQIPKLLPFTLILDIQPESQVIYYQFESTNCGERSKPEFDNSALIGVICPLKVISPLMG